MVLTTDAEIDAAILAAKYEEDETRAVSAKYLPKSDLIIVSLTDDTFLFLPRIKLQGLQNANTEDLSNIELISNGIGLSWPDLDVDLYVPALIQGIYGTKQWMNE